MSITLHHGDCIEFMRSLPDLSVDHVIADPPYSEHVHGNARTNATADKVHRIAFSSLTTVDMRDLAAQYARICKRWVVLFCAAESIADWRWALTDAGLEWIRAGYWLRKGAPQLTGDRPAAGAETIAIAHRPGKKRWNGGGKDGVWYEPIPRGDERYGHATPKPIGLMRQLVADFTDPGDIILDSHMGSGTTGAACVELGRSFVGCELDAKHYETARKRVEAAQKQGTLFAPAAKPKQLGLPVSP